MNRILAILSIAILITGCAGTPHLTSPNGKIALDINQDSTTTLTGLLRPKPFDCRFWH